MNSLAGKTISVLLCGLVLLGQSAAWVHVATCEGGWATAQTRGEHADPVVTERDHRPPSCGHHHAHGSRSSQASDHESSWPTHSHDSDHCAVCQSLTWVGGTVVTESIAATGDAFVERQSIVDAPFVESFVVSCPRLRGPPIG